MKNENKTTSISFKVSPNFKTTLKAKAHSKKKTLSELIMEFLNKGLRY